MGLEMTLLGTARMQGLDFSYYTQDHSISTCLHVRTKSALFVVLLAQYKLAQ